MMAPTMPVYPQSGLEATVISEATNVKLTPMTTGRRAPIFHIG